MAPRALVSDPIAPACLEILRRGGVEVDYRPKLAPDALLEAVAGAHALVVRSGTKVTRAVLERGVALRVVGRAGVGVDNVDVAAATERGVAVLNTPGGNTLAAAELTMALMLALARHVPQANRALAEGRWERAAFSGIELHGKTLGVVGFGRIGREVARRSRSFGMRVMACDPLVPDAVFEGEGVPRRPLEALVGEADILTLHLPLEPATRGLFGADLLARCKPGVRLVNCSRGGLVDEAALLAALESGQVAGAALDVFETEPPRDFTLAAHPRVVATPHLGASTAEAQERVGEEVAREIARFLREGEAENIVNRSALAARR